MYDERHINEGALELVPRRTLAKVLFKRLARYGAKRLSTRRTFERLFKTPLTEHSS